MRIGHRDTHNFPLCQLGRLPSRTLGTPRSTSRCGWCAVHHVRPGLRGPPGGPPGEGHHPKRCWRDIFRLFYKMVEDILTLKETEERARQAADDADNGWTLARKSRAAAPAGSRRVGYQNDNSRTADFGRPEKIFAASDTCLNIFLRGDRAVLSPCGFGRCVKILWGFMGPLYTHTHQH